MVLHQPEEGVQHQVPPMEGVALQGQYADKLCFVESDGPQLQHVRVRWIFVPHKTELQQVGKVCLVAFIYQVMLQTIFLENRVHKKSISIISYSPHFGQLMIQSEYEAMSSRPVAHADLKCQTKQICGISQRCTGLHVK